LSMSDYWENRSEKEYVYRGEKFYTITPISLYHHRRSFIVSRLLKYIGKQQEKGDIILDYGCGDGWYLAYLARHGKYRLYGCDISPGFVQRALLACPADVRLADMPEGRIPFADRFDFVYSIAVLAHILSDEDLRRTVADIADHTMEGGHVFCFESTSSHRRQGPTWVRRTSQDYVRLFEEAGFRPVASEHLVYPLFTLYQLTAMRLIGRVFFRGSAEERQLAMNASSVMQKLGDVVVGLDRLMSFFPIRLTGNTLFVFQKAR